MTFSLWCALPLNGRIHKIFECFAVLDDLSSESASCLLIHSRFFKVLRDVYTVYNAKVVEFSLSTLFFVLISPNHCVSLIQASFGVVRFTRHECDLISMMFIAFIERYSHFIQSFFSNLSGASSVSCWTKFTYSLVCFVQWNLTRYQL